jgi:hypothetical protein
MLVTAIAGSASVANGPYAGRSEMACAMEPATPADQRERDDPAVVAALRSGSVAAAHAAAPLRDQPGALG